MTSMTPERYRELLHQIHDLVGAPTVRRLGVIYSGGVDSSILVVACLRLNIEPVPIYFDDGTGYFRQRQEPAMLRFLRPLGLLQEAVGIRAPDPYQFMGSDELGYVPGYKMTMQTLAMSAAEGLGLDTLLMGYMRDNDSYADETEASIQTITDAYNACYGTKIRVISPMRDMEKKEVIQLGAKLGVDYSSTMTCNEENHGGLVHCGECKLCKRRMAGFYAAGVRDPIIYANRVSCQ